MVQKVRHETLQDSLYEEQSKERPCHHNMIHFSLVCLFSIISSRKTNKQIKDREEKLINNKQANKETITYIISFFWLSSCCYNYNVRLLKHFKEKARK